MTQMKIQIFALLCVLCVETAWAGPAIVAPIDVEDAPAAEFAAEASHPENRGSGPLVIERGERWAPLAICREPAPGSALDFSGMGLQDAPAGKHGWLKNVGGHFEFERLPGVEQRFYGANICSAANFPDHATADRLVAALVRRGYNSIRIHHFDREWSAEKRGGSETQSPSFIDRLDYLLAKLYEAGLYVTADLYTTRNVMWRDIGIDRDGRVSNKQLYKTYVALHDGAFADWCFWARDFLEHVNPYTGRANKDEPGMPFLSLVNESRLHNGWDPFKKDDPVVLAAWREFSGSDAPPPPCDVGSVDPDDPFNQFDDWINRRMWERCSSFVRSLGCRALLTNDNNGRRHGEGQDGTPLYDYVDSHSYVYVPKWRGDRRKGAPLLCRQINPVRHSLPNILFLSGWAKGASKPHTISEWNLCAPGRCRSATGLIYGALAAEGEFDALWRFAYAHQSDILVDPPGGRGTIQSPLYDIAANPDMIAEDYAAVCLFLRGDALRAFGANDGALRANDGGASRQMTNGNNSVIAGEAGIVIAAEGRTSLPLEERPVIAAEGRTSLPPQAAWSLPLEERPVIARRAGTVIVDHERGALMIDTPLTCGGFAESGRIDAGALSFEIVESRRSKVETSNLQPSGRSTFQPFNLSTDGGDKVAAAVWVSSLDGNPIAESSRMLLVHLTDVQREGAVFSDETFDVMLTPGTAPLVEAGAAEVELRLNRSLVSPALSVDVEDDGRDAPIVFSLDAAGNRTGSVPCEWVPFQPFNRSTFQPESADGTLRFTVSTVGPDGEGRIYYEIVRAKEAME